MADIFNRYLEDYLATHSLSPHQHKVVRAIRVCRTAELGGHILRCDNPDCDYERQEYDSCKDRHCGKCQGAHQMRWVNERMAELLPIPYYHSTITMPHSLNTLALYNKRVIYDIFFKASAHTLNTFAQDPKFLGAKIGFFGILHTWGQPMSQHVHLHFLVPGGGISNDGKRWVGLPYRKDFLFPVKAVSKRLRKTFAEMLQKAYDEGKLVFPDELAHLAEPEQFKHFLNKVAWENWNSHIKTPFAGPEVMVKYLGRYTHRVAISNRRLLDIEDGKVTFRYKKYKDNKVFKRIMTLTAMEFIRRFLLHILPPGFKRIRHYGFLAPGCRTQTLGLAIKLLGALAQKIQQAKDSFEDLMAEPELRTCPVCKTGCLIVTEIPQAGYFAPG